MAREPDVQSEYLKVEIDQIEYEFYSQPVTQAGSWVDLTGVADEDTKKQHSLPALADPLVRRQLAKQKVHYPWFLGIVSILQILILGIEMYFNWSTTGSVIQTNPFNYMIGPSSGVLVMMGGRFLPCMKSNTGYDKPGVNFTCPAGLTDRGLNGTCTLGPVCQMPGTSFSTSHPDQWYRFITAVFLHGGVVHLLLNLSFQVNVGFQMEREMGWWRIALIYLISGAGGFIFGAPLSDIRIPTVGSSGALYGMVACLVLDLLQNWKLIKNPWMELAKTLGQVIFSFLIGTLPYIDNLAHVGGFVSGIFAGLLLLPKIYFGIWDRRFKQFGMIISIPALALFFWYFLNAFYAGENNCTWCQYFNCIPGMPWCEQKFNSVVTSLKTE